MRIAFLARSLGAGGAERQMCVLARGLRERGHEVTVFTFYRSGGALEEMLNQAGVTLVDLGKKGRWDVLAFLARLRRYLIELRPEVLHPYLVVPNILSVILRPVLPGTSVVWGIRAADMDMARYDWTFSATFRLSCWLSGLADLIIANSTAGMRYHAREGYPERKMVVISNGIDTDYFMRDPAGGAVLRRRWGIGPDESVVGMVARLDPVKDHETFLRAAATLGASVKKVRFVCVGEGPEAYGAHLRRLAAELGIGDRVAWAGAVADLPAVYGAFDLATLTSRSESFPNVVAEAMACGLPVVATDAGDCARIIGDFGLVVGQGDAPALAGAWRKMLSGMTSFDPGKSRRHIVENYSVEALVRTTEGRLAELAGVAP